MKASLCIVGIGIGALAGLLVAPVASSQPSSGYIVPKSRLAQAYVLIDPGSKGLPGGLKVKDVRFPQFEVKFQGPPGHIWVTIHPADLTLKKAPAWKGKRVAVTVGESTLKPEAQRAALKALFAILAGRESSWGWMRRSARGGTDRTQIQLNALADVHRDVGLGNRLRARERIMKIGKAGFVRRAAYHAARLLHQIGYRADARRVAKVRFATVAKAVAKSKATRESKQRLMVSLGQILALAGDSEKAMQVVAKLNPGPFICGGVAVAEDMAIAGDVARAELLLSRVILPKAPRCIAARALSVRLLLRLGDKTRALNAMKKGIRSAKGGMVAHAAKAFWALADDDPDRTRTALYAALAQNPGSAELLNATALHAWVHPPKAVQVRIAKEDAARQSQNTGLLLQVIAYCVATGDTLCADEFLAKAEKRPHIRRLLPGLKAVAMARRGARTEAAPLIKAAWRANPNAPLAIWAELELAGPTTEEGKRLKARLEQRVAERYAWKMNLADRAKAAPKKPSGRTSKSQPEPRPESGTGDLVVLLIVGLVGLGAFVLMTRRRKRGA